MTMKPNEPQAPAPREGTLRSTLQGWLSYILAVDGLLDMGTA